MTPEEIAEKKKAQIESEFKRFKLISEIRARKAKAREQEEAAAKLLKGPDEQEAEEKPPELEIKLAAKARRKFQKIAARGTCTVPMPKVPGKQVGTWGKPFWIRHLKFLIYIFLNKNIAVYYDCLHIKFRISIN
jgi:hypothetical protein